MIAVRTRFRVRQRQLSGDARAHRVAHHVRLLYVQVIEQPARVLGHDRGAIGGRIVELLAGAVTAVVERDHPVAVADEVADPAGIDPVGRGVRGEAMDEQDRRAGAFVEKRDLDSVGAESMHGSLVPLSREPDVAPARSAEGASL